MVTQFLKLLILDLEWNAAYSKRLGRYINEIIEIGAVLLDDALNETASFGVLVRSQLTSKLSGRFRTLTGISDEDMKKGRPFSRMLREFTAFAQAADAVVTWSTTDLHVFLDNCKSFTGQDTLPFLRAYFDLQPFIQEKLGLAGKNQIALGAAAGMLGVETGDYALHRAADDCRVCAEMLRGTLDAPLLPRMVAPADNPAFYERLLFKTYYIRDLESRDIDRAELRFRCDKCGAAAARTEKWKSRNQGFSANFKCRACGREFRAQVRFKKTWDRVIVKRSTHDIAPAEQKTEENQPKIADGAEISSKNSLSGK